MRWCVLVAVVIMLYACGTLGQATAAGGTPSGVEALIKHDLRALAAKVRSAAASASGTKMLRGGGSLRVLELAFRAHRGKLSKYGGYHLDLTTTALGVDSVDVYEFTTDHPYHLGQAATVLLYHFALSFGTDFSTLSAEYAHTDGFTWITKKLPPTARYDDAELTTSELDVMFDQALTVIAKATRHSPVSEETELHPGITCAPQVAGSSIRC